ncbi:MAG: GIY-YIG nuclease family protein [Gammaproteobacteria bacterium]|jgi:putative endonuclease
MTGISDSPVRGSGWMLYLIRTADDRLYTGITTDLDRRLTEHRAGGRRGAKALRGRAPLQLVFSCEFVDRSQASAAEYRVKQLSRIMKERLVTGDITIQSLLQAGGVQK